LEPFDWNLPQVVLQARCLSGTDFSADADSIGIPQPTDCDGTLQDSAITQVIGYKM
jgi:hypothetical protein